MPRFVLLFLPLLLSPVAVGAGAERPNVLFLAVDDMNDWIGCLGTTPRALTPNIDKLAARGVNFTNAHTAGVFCAPSRAAIFSGQYASTTGCYRTAHYFVNRPEIEPLQASFAKAGYTTLGAGKLFHHPTGAIDQRGWNEFFLRNDSQRKKRLAAGLVERGDAFPGKVSGEHLQPGAEGHRRAVFGVGRDPGGQGGGDGRHPTGQLGGRTTRQKTRQAVLPRLRDLCAALPELLPAEVLRSLRSQRKIELPPYKEDDLEDLPREDQAR